MAEEKVKETKPKGSDPIFPGGPTYDQIENWKKEYGELYMTEFDFGTFIWRTMDRLEYKKLLNEKADSDLQWYREERITEACIVWPEEYKNHDNVINGKAGVPSLLSEQILNKSGFVSNGGAIKL